MRRSTAGRSTAPLFVALCAVLLLIACSPEAEDATASLEPETAVQAAEITPTEPAPADLLRNGVMTEAGVLAGGQPSPEQLAALADAGFRTIINMRLPDEEGNTSAEAVEGLGMTYVTVPIEGAAGLSEESARAFSEVMSEVERPVVVHCGSGNRVGALFALKAFYVDGATAEEAIEIGLAAGMTRLEDAVRGHLATAELPDDS